MSTNGPDLLPLIQNRSAGLDPLISALSDSLLPAAIIRYNSEFGPRYFGRPPSEPIPTASRQLTEFRTRIGQLIEYALAVTIDSMLQHDYGDKLRLTFVPAAQFPDFYVRDAAGDILLRIDSKALHNESDEYSARFDLPICEIQPVDDLLLYVAWKWTDVAVRHHRLVYPQILEVLAVPAIEIAKERDLRLTRTGGTFDNLGRPVVLPKGKVDSNFGKVDRIVHQSRVSASDLPKHVRRFLEFTKRHAQEVQRDREAEPTDGEASSGR